MSVQPVEMTVTAMPLALIQRYLGHVFVMLDLLEMVRTVPTLMSAQKIGTIAMEMQHVRTTKGHFHVHATLDTLEMVLNVLILMNVPQIQITVTAMPHAPTRLDLLCAPATLGTQEMVHIA